MIRKSSIAATGLKIIPMKFKVQILENPILSMGSAGPENLSELQIFLSFTDLLLTQSLS